MKRIISFCLALLTASFAPIEVEAITISKPFTFTPGTTIFSSQVNANFDTVYNAVNGNLDHENIGSGGIYANQVIPTSSSQATFGGSQAYSFPNGIVANTRPSFLVSAQPYGAKCDNSTNDAAAIQAAATAASGVGNVAFPLFQTCLTNSQITATSNTGVVGDPAGYGILKAGPSFPSNATALLHFGPTANSAYSTGSPGSNVWIDHMKFDGTNMTGNAAYQNVGIFLCSINHAYVTNSYVLNMPNYGIYVGNCNSNATNFNDNNLDVRVENTILDGNGSGATHWDQLGGGRITDEKFDHITCYNNNGTCIDNVMVNHGVWSNIHSDSASANKGQIWSDYGSQYLTISDSYLKGGSIHVYGSGDQTVYPQHIIIARNRIQNGTSSIIVGGGNGTPSNALLSSYDSVSDNDILNDQASCISLNDVNFSTVVGNRCTSWDQSSGGNGGIVVNSVGGVNGSHGNVIANNMFDGGSAGNLFAYKELVSGKTGGNEFYQNQCGPRPAQTCTTSLDTGYSIPTNTGGNTNFSGDGGSYSAKSFTASANTQALKFTNTAGGNNQTTIGAEGSCAVQGVNDTAYSIVASGVNCLASIDALGNLGVRGAVNAGSVQIVNSAGGSNQTTIAAGNTFTVQSVPNTAFGLVAQGVSSPVAIDASGNVGIAGALHAAGAVTSPVIATAYASGSQLVSNPHIETFQGVVINATSTVTKTFGLTFASIPSCNATSHNASTQYPVNINGLGSTSSVTIFNGNSGGVTVDITCVGQ